MILSALLLGAASVASAQPAPPALGQVVVTRRADGEQMVLLGFSAFGSDADLGRLQEAANAVSAPPRRIEHDLQGRQQLMVLFLVTPRDAALGLLRDAIAGRYGQLRMEAMVISVADARGGLDLDRQFRVVDATALIVE